MRELLPSNRAGTALYEQPSSVVYREVPEQRLHIEINTVVLCLLCLHIVGTSSQVSVVVS